MTSAWQHASGKACAARVACLPVCVDEAPEIESESVATESWPEISFICWAKGIGLHQWYNRIKLKYINQWISVDAVVFDNAVKVIYFFNSVRAKYVDLLQTEICNGVLNLNCSFPDTGSHFFALRF